MKKLLWLFILVLIIPCLVYADSSGPRIASYEAIVTNKKGAKDIDGNGTLKYNTKVTVQNEYFDEKGKYYAEVCYIVNDICLNNYTIPLSDIMPAKEEFTLQDVQNRIKKYGEDDFYKINTSVIVFEKDGIKLSKGPASAYGTYDDLVEYMTIFKSNYVTYGGGGETPDNDWYYVDDGKHHGWIQVSSDAKYSAGVMLSNGVLTFSKTIFTTEDGNKVTIPAETILDEIYHIEKGSKYYIKYNYEQGFTSDISFGWNIDYNGIIVKESKITSIDGKTRITVPFGEKVRILYADMDEPGLLSINGMYYIQYKNTKGFIKEGSLICTYEDDVKKSTISFDYDVTMYDYNIEYYIEPNTSKVIETIPKGEKITTYYEFEDYVSGENGNNGYYIYWYLVDYNGKKGVVEMKREETENEKNNNNEVVPSKDKDNPRNKSSDIIIYAIVGSVILAATMVATIIIINSNKKLKKEEQKKKENIKLDNKETEIKKEEIKEEKVENFNDKKEIEIDKKDEKRDTPKTDNEIIKENNEEIVPKKNNKKIKK